MPHFLVQWKFKADSIAALRSVPQDRLATSIKLAEAFNGTVISFYNRLSDFDGLGIFLFPDVIHATAHSVHAMSTGAFDIHSCEQLLTSEEYKEALTLSHHAVTSYQPPNYRFGAKTLV